MLNPSRLITPWSLRQAEARRGSRVAGLGQGSDGAAFHKAETGPQRGVGNLGVLVEAGGQADATGQLKPAKVDGQVGAVGLRGAGAETELQRIDGDAMGGFPHRLRRNDPASRGCGPRSSLARRADSLRKAVAIAKGEFANRHLAVAGPGSGMEMRK